MKKCIIPLLVMLSFALIQSSHAQSPQRGLAITPNPANSGSWGAYHALIIGIDDYKEWPRLHTAVKDATVIRDTLVSRYGFDEKNVILRTDKAASRNQINRDLRYLATAMGPSDNMFIYYAGHGQLDDLTGDGYWVPAEGKLKDPSTWVSNAYIKAVLSSEKVQAKNVVVIADSCYSGSMLRGGPSLMSLDDRRYRQKLAKKAALRSRQVISSGGIEPVADGGAEGHSLFAFYLIDALRKNDREVIDLENLFHTKVWKPVTQIGEQRPNVGRLKTPMDQDGQFVLYNAAWVKEQTERQAAIEAKKQNETRQKASVALAELKMQRQRFEMEKQKLSLEKEQLAQQKALEVERLKFEKQKQEFEYAKLQAQLEQMKAKRKENELQAKANTAVAENLQASVDPRSLNNRSTASNSYSLAIFPFNIFDTNWGRSFIAENTEAALREIAFLADDYERLDLKFTYREIHGINYKVTPLQDVLKTETNTIWKKKSFFAAKEPDWEEVRKLGLKIDADLIIMLDRDVSSQKCTYFLFDTKKNKIYSKTAEAFHYGFGGFARDAVNVLFRDFFRSI